MSSHFNCIGFPVDNIDAYWALARRAAAEGTRMPVPGGSALARWGSSQGPEIWAQIDPAGEVTGITPFYATGAPHRIAITGIGEDPEEPLDGWIDGWLEPREPDEPYSGAFPLRTSLVDFALVRNRITTFPTLGAVEIAALASEVELYDNEAAYRAAAGEIYRPPVESFASAAHASVDEAPAFQEPSALVSGRIAQSRVLLNPVTESEYWWLQILVLGVTLHAFADRPTLGRDPRAGNIVSGTFWLVGKVADLTR
jgi:hypothetical protein